MPLNCNGIEDASRDTRESALEPLESEAPTDNGNAKDFAVKSGCKGFAEVPFVLVARTDISPYLNNMKAPLVEKLDPGKSLGDITNKYPIKLIDCQVHVLRHDLEQLKNDFELTYNMLDMYVTCRICKKNYPDLKKLRNHQATKHMIIYEPKPQKKVSFSEHVIVHEVKEYHKCRKCTKIFEDYRLLKTHMKKDHKKRKCYICYYCTKSFVDRTIFKVHIKLHCDVCGELLPNKAKYIDHRRYVCRVIKLHKCGTCNVEFFKFMDLKDHNYEHLSTFFICDICKDQFQTKCAVSHHIKFLHSKKRPKTLYEIKNIGNERLYLCNFCEESSVDKDFIEKHVELLPDLSNKAMTGYKDYYFCDQCLKKFDKEQEMLQHKWTHFLKASDSEKKDEEPKSRTTETDESSKLNNNIPLNRFFNINEKIPDQYLPKVVLTKMEFNPAPDKIDENFVDVNNIVSDHDIIDVENIDDANNEEYPEIIPQISKRAIVDKKSKKTLLSRHQCDQCDKYFSSGYCLRRHIQTVHCDYENLKCGVCEETFVWPSLLMTHKCIRAPLPEMPFDDARPEIHFDNLNMIEMLNQQAAQELQELNGIAEDDYMNCVDFEIPAPIVQLTEYENNVVPNNVFVNHGHGVLNGSRMVNGNTGMGHSLSVVSHSPSVVGHSPSVLGHSPSVLGHSPSVLGHSPSVLGHSPSVLGHSPLVAGHSPSVAGHSHIMAGRSPTIAGHGYTVAGHGPTAIGNGHTVVGNNKDVAAPVKSLGYKVVMQEVPIEF